MQAAIGLAGQEGADTFTFYVTTPAFLERTLTDDGYELSRGLVIVRLFDWAVVKAITMRICEDVRGESWEEIARRSQEIFLAVRGLPGKRHFRSRSVRAVHWTRASGQERSLSCITRTHR